MEVVGRLAGGISNDLNNLLTLVRSQAALLRESFPPGHPARKAMQVVEQATNRAAERAGRLLTFSRPSAAAPPPAPLPAEGETVLVAENDPHIRLLNQTILHQHGYRTLPADHGRQAVERYAQARGQVDLVLLDLGIPARPGGGRGPAIQADAQVLQELLALDPAVRVVLTSSSSPEDLPARVRPHVRTTVPKPYRAEQLLGAVREALEAHQPGPDATPETV
jgi:CheY-like chemotaxis protein